MKFNMKSAHRKVGAIVRDSKDREAAFSSLLSFCRKTCPSFPDVFDGMDIGAEVQDVAEQLAAVFDEEPIPSNVTTIYMGLFEAVSEEAGKPYAGYYVSGVEQFDPDDLDTLCDPPYFPEKRYLRSPALDRVVDVALEESDLGNFIFYAMMLGVAGILSRYALKHNHLEYKLVVGFDDGDVIEAS